jgi:hypothetical protein
MNTNDTQQTDSNRRFRGNSIIDHNAAMGFAYTLQPLVGKEPLPSTTGDVIPLHAFLLDSGVLPEGFEPAYGNNASRTWGSHPTDEIGNFPKVIAERTYTPGGVLRPDREDPPKRDIIAARVVALDGPESGPAQIEAAHEAAVWDEFSGEPTFDTVTDWVEAHMAESEVDGHRRTEITFRVPIIECHSGAAYRDSKPYWETAAVIQSTPWGVLGVAAELDAPSEPWRALETVSDLVDEGFQRIIDSEGTVDVSGYEQDEQSIQQTRSLAPVRWSEMSDTEQRRLVIGAIQVAHSDRDDGAKEDWVLKTLNQRYRAPEADVRATLDALIETGEIDAAVETRLCLAENEGTS